MSDSPQSQTAFIFLHDVEKTKTQHGKQDQWTLASTSHLMFSRWFPAVVVEWFIMFAQAYRILGCTLHETATTARLTLKSHNGHKGFSREFPVVLFTSGLRLFMLYPSLRNYNAGKYDFILEILNQEGQVLEKQEYEMQLKSKSKGQPLLCPLTKEECPQWLFDMGEPVEKPAVLQGKRKSTEEQSEKKEHKTCTKSRKSVKKEIKQEPSEEILNTHIEEYQQAEELLEQAEELLPLSETSDSDLSDCSLSAEETEFYYKKFLQPNPESATTSFITQHEYANVNPFLLK